MKRLICKLFGHKDIEIDRGLCSDQTYYVVTYQCKRCKGISNRAEKLTITLP